jgi:integrase
MALTDKQLKALEARSKGYKISDGGGLSVKVTPTGNKNFIYRFYFNKQVKEIHLGVYPQLPLKAARLERNRCKQMIIDGINPIEHKKREKLQKGANNSTIFQVVADEWLAMKKPTWIAKHYGTVKSRLNRLVYPKIGSSSLYDLDSAYLYTLLKEIQKEHSIPLGHNCKSYIGQIFSYAISLNKAARNPVSDLTGLLQPRQAIHYAAITDAAQLGAYLKKVDTFEGSEIVGAALRLTPLLFCRPGELRQLEWSFINWEENRIELPAQLMKMKTDHMIPMSNQAILLLKGIQESIEYNPRSPYVFQSPRRTLQPFSETTVGKAIRSIGYTTKQVVPHGFRATARTLLDEVLEYPVKIIEQQLAHTVKDINGRAYNRTKHLKQRSEMMQAWADYLDKLKGVK